MASPMSFPPAGGGWNNSGQPAMPPSNPPDDSGLQARPVGLKVLYRLDKDAQFDCLARPPQTFHVQTVPIDDTTTIGVIDLRACVQAVVDCSPELPGKECDYAIYAHDYSEPGTPLMGQGTLSSALQTLHYGFNATQAPKMITGLVTQNKIGLIMGSANKEILEVKIKLTETARPPQPQYQQQQMHPQTQQPPPHMQHTQPPQHEPHMQVQQQLGQQLPHMQQQQHYPQQQEHQNQPDIAPARSMEAALTPTGNAEWNSFMQSNPHIGHTSNVTRVASPVVQGPQQVMPDHSDALVQQPQLPPMPPQQDMQRIAPMPVDQPSESMLPQGPSSRPSSRVSNRGPSRRKMPTGRPRGRPRKKPVEGNTSGYEDGTEGEDGPAKKRVKTTMVDKSSTNPFGGEPESLRVAASTSGSLRSFRPIAISREPSAGSNLQEVPRAPTPVPNGPLPGRAPMKGVAQREQTTSRAASVGRASPRSQRMRPLSPSLEDARSPESMAHTPAFSDDSAADIGSSPPVPRAASFIRSSPPPSSPMLPPMPETQAIQDVMETDDIPNFFVDEATVAQPQAPVRAPVKIAPAPIRKNKIGLRRTSSTIPMEVFRMEDGPAGQDLVHLRSFAGTDPQSEKQRSGTSQKQGPTQTAFGAPTPPQTTDATEKPTSPPIPPEAAASEQKMAKPDSLPPPRQEAAAQGLQAESSAPAPKPTAASAEPAQKPSTGALVNDDKAEGNPASPIDPAPTEEQLPPQTSASNGKAPAPSRDQKPRPNPRKLARSQSAGPLILPAVPASEPAGPSSLSQSIQAETSQTTNTETQAHLRRSRSSGPTNISIPASDPVGPPSSQAPMSLAMPKVAPAPLDTLPLPPSSPQGEKSRKNLVKKNAIKERLEAAIKRGEMPPYCSNCGAIETPTWRKIYAQEHTGIPPHYDPTEFSTKPGMISTIEVLARDQDESPTHYRLVKKALGPREEKEEWQEMLLCNPCGIWLGKFYAHRPPDRWRGDEARLGRERKKRTGDAKDGSRARRSRSKSHGQPAATSEADVPMGRPAQQSPPKGPAGGSASAAGSKESTTRASGTSGSNVSGAGSGAMNEFGSVPPAGNNQAAVDGPDDVAMDETMGTTKRLLFPSPRKDDSPKALGELDVNSVYSGGECRQRKELTVQKENVTAGQEDSATRLDDLEDLFRSPAPPRPSTPPSMAKSGAPTTPFKTPTRATPSHRPVTRSVSRSMRSKESLTKGVSDVEKTPSLTPSRAARFEFGLPMSAAKRRSPQHHPGLDFDDIIFDTPMSRAVNQMLSEPNFGLDDEMELVGLGSADDTNWANYSSFFSTDAPMPSSPPKDRIPFGGEDAGGSWATWSVDQVAGTIKEK